MLGSVLPANPGPSDCPALSWTAGGAFLIPKSSLRFELAIAEASRSLCDAKRACYVRVSGQSLPDVGDALRHAAGLLLATDLTQP